MRISLVVALPIAIVLLIALVIAIPSATMADTPPVPEPPTPTPDIWDKSSVQVTGLCNEGTPIFTITNTGSAMLASRLFWFLNLDGGASSCDGDIANAIGGGSFQLGAGASVDVVFPKGILDPPYRLCVAQALGHPGIGWASATIGQDDVCITAEEVVAEPGLSKAWLFVPWAGK